MAAEPSLFARTLAKRRVEGVERVLLYVSSAGTPVVPDSGFLGSEARASFRLAPPNNNKKIKSTASCLSHR